MPEWIGRARQYRNVAVTLRRIARDSVDRTVIAAADEVARDYERMAADLERGRPASEPFSDLRTWHH
ncbi:MAG TPA: hypothetical protein VHT03_07795 [Rhizomicrobium sp.]|jgi:hypothetical protein|nr:hypothetical protein [Rhizomicrobium sp.]